MRWQITLNFAMSGNNIYFLMYSVEIYICYGFACSHSPDYFIMAIRSVIYSIHNIHESWLCSI